MKYNYYLKFSGGIIPLEPTYTPGGDEMGVMIFAHKQGVSQNMFCRCGSELTKKLINVEWTDDLGKTYKIEQVPCLYCDHCESAYYEGNVQFSLSVIADELEQISEQSKVFYQDRI